MKWLKLKYGHLYVDDNQEKVYGHVWYESNSSSGGPAYAEALREPTHLRLIRDNVYKNKIRVGNTSLVVGKPLQELTYNNQKRTGWPNLTYAKGAVEEYFQKYNTFEGNLTFRQKLAKGHAKHILRSKEKSKPAIKR